MTPVVSPSNTLTIETVKSSAEIAESFPTEIAESLQSEIVSSQSNVEIRGSISNVDICGTESDVDICFADSDVEICGNESTVEFCGNESSKDVSDSSDESLTGTEVKLCIGDSEKFVAHSKLQSLLAQLEKGKDFGTEMGTKNVQHSASEPKLMSTSPANFSFLCGSVGNAPSSSLSVKSTMGR